MPPANETPWWEWPWKFGPELRPSREDKRPPAPPLFDREPWGIVLFQPTEEIIEASMPGHSGRFTWDPEAGEWRGYWRRRPIRSKNPRNLLRWLERLEDSYRDSGKPYTRARNAGRCLFHGGPYAVAFDHGRTWTGPPIHWDDDARIEAAAVSLGMGTKMMPSNRYGSKANREEVTA